MLVQLYNSLFWWPFNYFSLINEFNVLIIILKFSIIKISMILIKMIHDSSSVIC